MAPAFGTDSRVRFAQRTDEVAAATGHKDRLFELVAEAPPRCGSPASEGTSCGGGEGSPGVGLSALELSPQAPGARSRSGSPGKRDQDSERDQDTHSDRERRSDCGDGTVRWLVAAAPAPHGPADPAALPCGSGRRSSCGGGVCSGGGGGGGVAWVQMQAAGLALAEAAQAAAVREPRFDALKLRFKLGKTLFRNLGPRACKGCLGVSDLEDLAGSGRGAAQPTFSGYLPSASVPLVASWLTSRLGFSLAGRKTSATLHVVNQELNLHTTVALAMERHGDDSSAVLRKVKAGSPRCHSVSLLAGPGQMDLRLKLSAQYWEHPGLATDPDAQSTARRIVAAVRSEGFEGFSRSRRGMPRNRHLEYARRKTKDVYEGWLQAVSDNDNDNDHGSCHRHRVRVSIMRVQDDWGCHYEVSGSLPDLDASLAQLLHDRPPAPAPCEYGTAPEASGGSAGAPAADITTGRCASGAGPGAEGRVEGPQGRCRVVSSEASAQAASALCALAGFVARLNQHLAASVAAC